MKVILLFKSYSEFMFKYSSEISQKKKGKFKSTSNVGAYPKVKMMEMWPYMIYSIRLSEFQKNEIK